MVARAGAWSQSRPQPFPGRELAPLRASNGRWAELLLHGIQEVPAEKMLIAAEQVRQALADFGISEVCIEVRAEDDMPDTSLATAHVTS